jgi:hypothetical protein
MSVHASFLPRRLVDGALIIVVALVSLYGIARVGLAPRDPASGVGLVFGPWVDARSAMQRATAGGARFVRYGGLPFIVVVMPDTPRYFARMSTSGALLIVDPQALAACLSFIGGEAAS